MTAQQGDIVVRDGVKREMLGHLWVEPHPRIVDNPKPSWGTCSSCWRGTIGTWTIVDDDFCLSHLEGRLMLTPGPLLPATWITAVVRVVAGRIVSYVHAGFLSEYSRVREFDIRSGKVVRSRLLAYPANADSPSWLRLRSARTLFAAGEGTDPLAGLPQRATYEGRRVRERCRELREHARLRPGELTERMGLSPGKGGVLVEWERGERKRPASFVAAACAALGLDETARMALNTEDIAEYEQSLAAFLDAPIRRTIKIADQFYLSPSELPADDESAIRWARACVDTAWREGVLYLDRRRIFRIDLDGSLVPETVRFDDN